MLPGIVVFCMAAFSFLRAFSMSQRRTLSAGGDGGGVFGVALSPCTVFFFVWNGRIVGCVDCFHSTLLFLSFRGLRDLSEFLPLIDLMPIPRCLCGGHALRLIIPDLLPGHDHLFYINF